MERIFQITAVILVGVAAYFLWRRNMDATFVTAVLGAVAFFLSIRFQVKGRLSEREAERRAREEAEQADTDETFDELTGADELTADQQTISGQRDKEQV